MAGQAGNSDQVGGQKLPELPDDVIRMYGKPLTSEQALDQIQEMLFDPEWGVGMLEDIRALVERTGRSCENYPDDRPTWDRH